MKRRIPPENTARVLALAFAFFGVLVVLGITSGAFARLGGEILALLAAFALGFALLTYWLDGQVRAWVNASAAALRARSPQRDRNAAALTRSVG